MKNSGQYFLQLNDKERRSHWIEEKRYMTMELGKFCFTVRCIHTMYNNVIKLVMYCKTAETIFQKYIRQFTAKYSCELRFQLKRQSLVQILPTTRK